MPVGPPSRIEVYFNLFYLFLKVPIDADLDPFLSGQACRRQDRASLFGLDPDENASTSPIKEVIRQGAQSVPDRLRVAAFFELQPLRFDQAPFEDFVDTFWASKNSLPREAAPPG